MTRTTLSRVLPVRFQGDFLERVDGRSLLGREVRMRIEGIEADLGGPDALSHAQRSLVRRAVWLELCAEQDETRIAEGGGIDIGPHTQLVNTLVGLYKTLGLKRQAREARLSDYLKRSETTLREGSP
jgi:hypothetical protein